MASMATPPTATEQALRKLEEYLTCAICLDFYTEPKLLQCFHVFCKQCLERLVVHDRQGLSLHCPSCRVIISLPPAGISGLQTAFYLSNLLESGDTLEKVKEPQKTQCEECKKHIAINFCRDCKRLICARCTETHQGWLSSHEVITLDQLEGDVAQLFSSKKKVLFCSKHPTKELNLYCETCEELVCRDCTVHIHRDHQYDLVTDAFQKHKDVLVTSLQPVEQQLDTVTKSLQQLDTQCQLITDQRETLVGNIHKTLDSIRGVEVIEETDFVVSTRGDSFEWKGYGLRLSISENSLPIGIEECRINIKASLSGPFELPEDLDLLSPVFWISALCKFEMLVSLEIQHCASRDEASFTDLNFISAKCSQKELPYTFKQLDGGRFPADSSYGSIQLSHFSGIGIAGKKGTPRAYCAQIYYTIKEEASDWRFYFIITKDLDTLKTVVGKHYCQEATFQVRFGRSKISLDIPENGQVTKDGWRITPSTHPTIYRKDVDEFVPGLCIPQCELLVEWDPKCKDKKPVRLRHKINLIGASKPFNFFNLSLNPIWKDKPEVVRHQSTSSGGSVEYSLASKYPAGLDSEPELPDLMNEVAAEISGKWRDVGLQLGMDHGVLDGIATISLGDTNRCYSNVFTRWKNQNSTAHPYTWLTIVHALQAPAVGEERLANKIKTKLTES